MSNIYSKSLQVNMKLAEKNAGEEFSQLYLDSIQDFIDKVERKTEQDWARCPSVIKAQFISDCEAAKAFIAEAKLIKGEK